MDEKKILIQGAKEIEVEYLLANLTEKQESNIAGYEFYEGMLGDRKVVIAKTKIGVIHATTATTIGIIHFKPDVVINQGIAGAHREDLHIGDIVIGEKCCNINAYKMPEKKQGEGSNPFTWEPNKRAKEIQKADLKLVQFIEEKLKQNTTKKVYRGILGSGDVFNRENDRICWLRQTFENDSEDMESIGTYSVCNNFGIPCVGIRIISNNERLREKIEENQAIELQKILRKALVSFTKRREIPQRKSD